jgi:hypothetical protein
MKAVNEARTKELFNDQPVVDSEENKNEAEENVLA